MPGMKRIEQSAERIAFKIVLLVLFSFSYPARLRRNVIPAKAGIQKSKLDAGSC